MHFQSALRNSEIGLCHPTNFQYSTKYEQMMRLEVGKKQLSKLETGSVTSMELDPIHGQYLISAGSKRSIHIHNTLCHFSSTQIPLWGMVDKTQKEQHKKAIHKIQWYPYDTGIFVSSSFDHTIKIWDTNRLKVVETVCLSYPICDHQISSSLQMLIAAATSSLIRLTDMRTGSTSHILEGHQENVLCLKWSPKDAYILASGGEDNKIFFWDIRRAKGVLKSMDQHNGKEDSSKNKKSVMAHNGNVNSLLFNCDGNFLLSFGTDERLRLWNTETGKNTLVNYGRIENTSQHRPLYMAMMDGGSHTTLAIVPSACHILLINLFTGEVLKKICDQFSSVLCCEFNSYTQDLYSSAHASRVLVLSPHEGNKWQLERGSTLLKDTWSDSD